MSEEKTNEVINEEVNEEITSTKDKKPNSNKKSTSSKPKHKADYPDRVDVTLDTTEEDVLKYNEEGKNLFFDGDLDSFKVLSDNTIDQLSYINRQRYFSSYGEYKYNLEHKDEENITSRIQVSPRYATATGRLEVHGKDPRFHYCWKRPDELRQAKYEGYEVADDDALDTFQGKDKVSSLHKVGAYGDDELVLTKIPQELFDERQRAIQEKSTKRIKAVEDTAKDEMRRAGGLPYEPPKGPGGPNFTPPSRKKPVNNQQPSNSSQSNTDFIPKE
jgi:hypothetical protein